MNQVTNQALVVQPRFAALAMPPGSSVYCGYDPTAESIHLGNLVSLVTLAHFRAAGYRPIVLFGGATGLIGDPSGRSTERNLLEQSTIEKNIRSFQNQFGHLTQLLSLAYEKHTGRGSELPDFHYVNNRDFYDSLSAVAFLRDIGKHFRVNTMLSRDSVKSRMHSSDCHGDSEGISFTEFSY